MDLAQLFAQLAGSVLVGGIVWGGMRSDLRHLGESVTELKSWQAEHDRQIIEMYRRGGRNAEENRNQA